MKLFAQQCVSQASFWNTDDETQLEFELQRNMPLVLEPVLEKWERMKCNEDSRFLVERALAPSLALQSIGGYANGVRSYEWASFPFREIGKILAQALKLSESNDESPEFVKIRDRLHQCMPHKRVWSDKLQKEVCVRVVGKYGLTHKMRTHRMAEGQAHSVTGWYGGIDMSRHNTHIWKKLGKPTTSQYCDIIGKFELPIACGYNLCFVGALINDATRTAEKQGKSVRDAMLELCSDLKKCDPLVLSERIKAARRDRRDDDLWVHAQWQSPRLMLASMKGVDASEDEISETSEVYLEEEVREEDEHLEVMATQAAASSSHSLTCGDRDLESRPQVQCDRPEYVATSAGKNVQLHTRIRILPRPDPDPTQTRPSTHTLPGGRGAQLNLLGLRSPLGQDM
jgi:hypothetical protein